MVEGSGLITHDWSKARHPTKLIYTPTWTTFNDLNLIELDGALQTLQIYSGDTADMDFVAGKFSIEVWIYFDAIGTKESILTRGQEDVDGYALFKDSNDAIAFETYQAAASQESKTDNGIISATTWYHVLISRSGNSVRIYINGVDQTSVVGAHINPVTATRQLTIGRA